MASLLYLKHSFNLSDEELVVRWSENVLWQFFSGMQLVAGFRGDRIRLRAAPMLGCRESG
jgi:hypothetical protein